MKFHDLFAADEESRRTAVLAALAFLTATIAFADISGFGQGWSVGVLYLFPMLIAALHLSRVEVLLLAVLCTVLREALGPFAWKEGLLLRSSLALIAFGGAGLSVRELAGRQRRRFEQERQLREQAKLRQAAEQQLQALIETSPVAILTMDVEGDIQRANHAAQDLLGFGREPLRGEPIGRFLPPLASLPQAESTGPSLRTMLECKARRRNGDIFPAHVWLSNFHTVSGSMLAAIVLDTSEDLRDREELGFDQLMKSSRILVRAVSHEIRNACAAIAVVHANLRRVPGIERNEDFQALGTLVEGLGKLVSTELRTASLKTPPSVNLREVFEEFKIIVEPSFAEVESVVDWAIPDHLPLVAAERHGLLHIFMNLAANSQHALRRVENRRMTIKATVEQDRAVVRFADTGPGVEYPERLFQPFRHSSEGAGLGLYLSRALARSFAGELRYEPQPYGSCFAVELPLARQPDHAME